MEQRDRAGRAVVSNYWFLTIFEMMSNFRRVVRAVQTSCVYPSLRFIDSSYGVTLISVTPFQVNLLLPLQQFRDFRTRFLSYWTDIPFPGSLILRKLAGPSFSEDASPLRLGFSQAGPGTNRRGSLSTLAHCLAPCAAAAAPGALRAWLRERK